MASRDHAPTTGIALDDSAEPDVYGIRRAILHLLEVEPVYQNELFHDFHQEGQSRRKTKNKLYRVLHELRDLGYAENDGTLWDATPLGLRALANARARSSAEPADGENSRDAK